MGVTLKLTSGVVVTASGRVAGGGTVGWTSGWVCGLVVGWIVCVGLIRTS